MRSVRTIYAAEKVAKSTSRRVPQTHHRHLFAVLNADTSSRGAKKKELLEAHACFTREFLLLFEEHGLIQED
jgi:hypothetical protein